MWKDSKTLIVFCLSDPKEEYLLTYNKITLAYNPLQSGHSQTEVLGQHIQESIEEIGHRMYQEI